MQRHHPVAAGWFSPVHPDFVCSQEMNSRRNCPSTLALALARTLPVVAPPVSRELRVTCKVYGFFSGDDCLYLIPDCYSQVYNYVRK
mgnify:FL=1|jgi:hypothetical protein